MNSYDTDQANHERKAREAVSKGNGVAAANQIELARLAHQNAVTQEAMYGVAPDPYRAAFHVPDLSPAVPRDQFDGWKVLAGLGKALGAVCLLAAAIYAIGFGLKAADQLWSHAGGGFNRFARDETFAGETLAPSNRFLSPREVVGQLEDDRLISALSLIKGPLTNADAKNSRLMASSYRCVTNDSCRMKLESASHGTSQTALSAATVFLYGKAKAGDEAAARDACLLPILLGSRQSAASQAYEGCLWIANTVTSAAPNKTAFLLKQQMEQSMSFRLAMWIGDGTTK